MNSCSSKKFPCFIFYLMILSLILVNLVNIKSINIKPSLCSPQDSNYTNKLKGVIVIYGAPAPTCGLHDGFFPGDMLQALVFLGGVMKELPLYAAADALEGVIGLLVTCLLCELCIFYL